MAYHIRWLQENRVIYLGLYDEITLEEVEQFHQQWNAMMDEGQAPVHAILDAVRVDKYPLNLPKVLKSSTAFSHTAIGWVLPCGAPSTANMIVSVVAQFTGRKYRTFRTHQEAATFLIDIDDSLDIPQSEVQAFPVTGE